MELFWGEELSMSSGKSIYFSKSSLPSEVNDALPVYLQYMKFVEHRHLLLIGAGGSMDMSVHQMIVSFMFIIMK